MVYNAGMASRVRVFIATSLDGFIAGPNDELDWLAGGEGVEDTFTPFFAQIGALLMGRRTYDVVAGFDVKWPYGDKPVLVATHRPLTSARKSVSPIAGTIEELLAKAQSAAGEADVYLDGGALIRQALEAGLVHEMTITLVPIVLGAGIRLFVGTTGRHSLELLSERSIGGGMVELTYRPWAS